MKILIAYDGSSCSEAALDDLARAGLPEAGEFLVISVVEVWLPPENIRQEWEAENLDSYLNEINRKHDKKNNEAVAEVKTMANHAARRLLKMFPGWTVSTEATFGSPAWEVLTKADDFKPDLIVAGSQGHSAVGRFFLGSISQKVLTEAHCSVRVARGSVEVDPTPPVRIIIGFDGSKGAQAAVEAIARRQWREGSEFRLVTATGHVDPQAIGRFIPPVANWLEGEMQYEREWMEKLAAPALQILQDAGCTVTRQTVAGNPKQSLVEEAERWHADAIFVGVNRFGGRVERFLLGSVAAAVAARANCSVEVVRKFLAD
jgi:nucleotide-binding universal stress UspA family protein